MSYYKLVASGRPDVVINELIIDRDEESGDEVSVSTSEPRELSGDQLSKALSVAKKYGYGVEEVDEPENVEESQPVGADVVGMSPVVESDSPGDSTGVSQQAQEEISEEADSEGSSGGVGGSAGSTSADVSGGAADTGTTGGATTSVNPGSGGGNYGNQSTSSL